MAKTMEAHRDRALKRPIPDAHTQHNYKAMKKLISEAQRQDEASRRKVSIKKHALISKEHSKSTPKVKPKQEQQDYLCAAFSSQS